MERVKVLNTSKSRLEERQLFHRKKIDMPECTIVSKDLYEYESSLKEGGYAANEMPDGDNWHEMCLSY